MWIQQGYPSNHLCRQSAKKRKTEVIEEFNDDDDDDNDLEDKGCIDEILDNDDEDDDDECAVEPSDDEEAESDIVEENVAAKDDPVDEKSNRLRLVGILWKALLLLITTFVACRTARSRSAVGKKNLEQEDEKDEDDVSADENVVKSQRKVASRVSKPRYLI